MEKVKSTPYTVYPFIVSFSLPHPVIPYPIRENRENNGEHFTHCPSDLYHIAFRSEIVITTSLREASTRWTIYYAMYDKIDENEYIDVHVFN
jgi:hypothetical protein